MSKLEELIARLCPDGVEYKELGEILKIKNGKDYKGFAFGDIPVYGSGGIMTYIDQYVYDWGTCDNLSGHLLTKVMIKNSACISV